MYHLRMAYHQIPNFSSQASHASAQKTGLECQDLLVLMKPSENKKFQQACGSNRITLYELSRNSNSKIIFYGSSQKQFGSASCRSPFTEVDSSKRSQGGGTFSNKQCLSLPRPFDINAPGNSTNSDEGQAKWRVFPEPTATSQKTHTEEFGSDAWADASPPAREFDIESQLPELKEMLGFLKRRWTSEQDRRKNVGNVFLVGTGPGDPQLLTLKALLLMQKADLVLYDRLVSTDILDMVHAGARLLYVGKTSGYHSRTQEEIHQLLLSFAEAGATVVRLKGGDPLVFGRGGEEMDFLQDQGIQVKIVPGITAASGIAAELGIPLTHRGAANSVRFLTGHSRKGGTDPLYVAAQAADPDSTLVIYMGLQTLPGLAAKLLANGLPPDTPAVAVERGTTSQQRTVFACLKDLPSEVELVELVSPTLIIIGQVVMLSPFWPRRTSLNHDDSSSATSKNVKNNSDLYTQARDRSVRDADPALPSQRVT
ncbi:hypothetical protein O6H91_02G011000 [Diphasiastrum complanatum]|uniref:Uncharacterized protein n=3 Tax=Diphasiastrum complanatum TaxID=34168 RepID=A0ACC2ED13_DIPCM|nr:hypothetical protein O6H91_Y194000 [Diphasiastrum complanatum]KAJ7564278.1 hypothetical protein O6H91_02G011000 [Diphasiastrum complanatum]KAJ7564279.1 hypothetical protein O6H91_02G011000 [Diphasiastrum complanatum]KAJ7564280.1 hypothetical protein O6H91_02G011000 [Diphasiastrum complanatum]